MIYFLSDAHIGARALGGREERVAHQMQVVELLQQMARDAEAVYILGDFFDFWYEYLWPDRDKDEYEPVLSQLRQMSEQGIALHFFPGNHDLWTFGWLSRKTGAVVHRRQPEEMMIAGKRCLLGHGDGLVPSGYVRQLPRPIRRKIRRFQALRALFHSRVAQHLFRLVPPAWGNGFGYAWARQSRLKEMAAPCGYKGENEEELVLLAKETERRTHYDYYLFGHRHIELDLELATGARVVILGDLFRQFCYAKMTSDGKLELCTI